MYFPYFFSENCWGCFTTSKYIEKEETKDTRWELSRSREARGSTGTTGRRSQEDAARQAEGNHAARSSLGASGWNSSKDMKWTDQLLHLNVPKGDVDNL